MPELKRELDCLYARREIAYAKPVVQPGWAALRDSYEFGYAKGVFDAIFEIVLPSYHGAGDKFEAFTAGYAAGSRAEKKTPKYLQIVNAITESIKKGKLQKGDRIFSINELSNEYFLSRDTVQKAYDLLEERGIIEPVKGKGFYISRTDITSSYRILLLFNKISNYKKQIYSSSVICYSKIFS